MYDPNVLTDSERGTPPGIQAMREELQDVHAISPNQLDPDYTNAYTMDEIQYLNEMPMFDRFETSHRPMPGIGRNILHAAAIFDPDFTPAPTQYQLPPRPGQYYGEMYAQGYRLENGETHQRNDSGYESVAYTLMGGEDEDDGIDAWCDAVLAQASLIEPNQHILRPDALEFRPGIKYDADIHDDVAGEETREASQHHDGGVGHPVVGAPPSHRPELYFSASHDPDSERDRNRDERYMVTDHEMEILDYEGLDTPLVCGVRGTHSEGVESEYNEATYDDQFETGSRARWSI